MRATDATPEAEPWAIKAGPAEPWAIKAGPAEPGAIKAGPAEPWAISAFGVELGFTLAGDKPRRYFGVALALIAGTLACDPPAPSQIALPAGLELAALPDAQRALLRATLAVDGGALAETDATLDVENGTVAGDFALQNVTATAEHVATLHIYGRFDVDAAEVLLGAVDAPLTVTPAQETRLSFDGASFQTCDAGLDGLCSIVFDENRNRRSNIDDLLPVSADGLGIDPAPQAPFLDASPSTLQFPSGIRLGTFARQVIVIENSGAHPVRVLRADVVGGPGTALSLFDPSGLAVTGAPRRALDADAFTGSLAAISGVDPSDPTAGHVSPGDEVLIGVSFAPVSSFFTTGAVQIVVEDTVTRVVQTARVKLIANADGALRPAAPEYVEPDVDSLDVDEGAVSVTAFPAAQLYSGLAITGASTSAGGLARTGAVLLTEDAEGAPLALAADAAFVVDVPAGHRFATSLGGLASDVDLGVFQLDSDGSIVPACASCVSSHAGASPEAAELTNRDASTLRVLVVLGRVDAGPIAAPVEGALVEGAPLVDFDLTAQVTFGPELADDTPVAPSEGPVEGGVPVTLRGRGFDTRATVTFADAQALDVVVTTDAAGDSTITLTLPPGSLEAGKNPATIVVANPAVDDGGDGQAATLPEGFFFQPPAPRLTTVSPDFAVTTGAELAVSISGSFFSSRNGAPVVTFGDASDSTGAGAFSIDVTATFESSTRIVVVPPALPVALQDGARTVGVTVRNRLPPSADAPNEVRLGAASNARPFRFLVPVGAPPSVSAVAPSNGSTDGGTSIVVTGSGFRDGASVLVGGVAADTGVPEEGGTRLVATTPAHALAGAVDVVVINSDGQSGVRADAFTYEIPAPTLTGVFPNRAVVDGDAVLALSGTGFREGARVRFTPDAGGDDVDAASATRLSSTTMLAQTPSGLDEGVYTITVENLDGQSATSSGFAIFEADGPAPQIVGLDPANGGAGGGYLVTITGRDFVAPRVLFSGALLASNVVTFVDAAAGGIDRLSFAAPASSSGGGGIVGVQVVNADQQSDSATFTYTVATPASPRVDRAEPALIAGTAPTLVRLFGANLADVVSAFAGGVAAPVNVLSPVAVLITVPPSAEGLLTLSVVTASGDAASFPVVVRGAPVLAGLSSVVVHAGVAGDQVTVFGSGLDAGDLVVDVVGASEPDVVANVLLTSSSLMLVELPRLDAANDLRLRVRPSGAAAFGEASNDGESPPFSARAPEVALTSVTNIAQNGALTLSILGAHLNAGRLSEVLLVDLSGSGRSVPCALESAGESALVCRTSIAAFPSQSYGVAFRYVETFGGASAPIDVVVTEPGAGGFDVPLRVFIPDVGQLAECGDEFVRPDEECDDGNLDDSDNCTSQCLRARCGDGLTGPGESCDDGNDVNDDACRNGCVLASCGDGALQVGELCDDGNAVNDDACSNACTVPVCGDGIAQSSVASGANEECDDGNTENEDDCLVTCVLRSCGDGFVQPGEACDDGNTADGDGCDATCVLADAALVAAPALHDFGSVVVGQSSAPAIFRFQNAGDLPSGVLTAALTGPGAAAMDVVSNTCAGVTLAATATCTITVSFQPATNGSTSATLTVSGLPGGAASTALGGTGLVAAGLAVAPGAFAFGSVIVGANSGVQLFTFSNTGDQPTSPLAVVLGGSDALHFATTTNTCGGTILAGGAQCTVGVRFSPTTSGSKAASLTVSGAPGGSDVATLSGVGVTPASLVIAPSSHDHGSVVVGQPGAPRSFTVTNTGGSASGVVSAFTSGADAGSFPIVGDTCSGVSVGASGSCTVTIQFVPTSAVPLAANLNVSASPGGAVTATNSGTGVAGAALSMLPTTLDYGARALFNSSVPADFLLENVGSGTSGALSVSLTGSSAFEIVGAGNCGATIAPGAQNACFIRGIRFLPTSAGAHTAVFAVSASPGGTVTTTLSGFGTTCGDSVVGNGEGCDDGGNASGDGCDASCFVEAGFTCVGAPSVCTPASGGPGILTNSDFSGGLTGWTSQANPLGDSTTWQTDAGGRVFMPTSLGAGARVLTQSFVVPPVVSTASFSLFLAMEPPPGLTFTSPNISVIQNDEVNNGLRIDLIAPGGEVFSNTILHALATPAAIGAPPSSLQLVSANSAALTTFLQANQGATLVLRIGQVESTFPFQVFLDDVVLDVQ